MSTRRWELDYGSGFLEANVISVPSMAPCVTVPPDWNWSTLLKSALTCWYKTKTNKKWMCTINKWGGGSHPGAMEIAQSGRCLLYKHGEPVHAWEDRNCFVCVVCPMIPALEVWRQSNPWSSLVSQGDQWASDLLRDPISKNKHQVQLRKEPQCQHLTSTCMHTCTNPH